MGEPYDKRGERFYLKGAKRDIEVLPDLIPLLKPIGEVKPDPSNPRKTVSLETLVAGIQRFGVRWPILVNKRTGIIEAGHQRLYACQDIGLMHIPVIWADDDNVTAAGFNISDNRLGEIVSEWDDDALAVHLQAMLKEGDEAIAGIGFEREEVEWLISEYKDGQGEGGAEPPDPPDPDTVPAITSLGDVWKMGPHRLICGDSTDRAVIDKVMDGEAAKMIFTDPPYNVAYGKTMKDKLRGNHREIENDDLGEEFRPFLLKTMQAMLPVCEGAIYICMSSSELDTLQGTFREAGGHWSTFIIWAKNTFTIGRSDYQRQYEPILYGWREGATDRHWCGDRDQADVWNYDKPRKNDLHPCLSPDSMIVTDKGYQPISDVGIGDSVFGHDGKFHSVKNVTVHEYKEDIFHISVSGSSLSVSATHNHPFLIRRRVGSGQYDDPRFVEASDLLAGDYVLTPKLECGVGRSPSVDEAWAIGLFAAEGSFLKAGNGKKQFPRFSLHVKEGHLVKLLELAFKAKASVYDNHGNGMNVVFFDSDWGDRLEKMCGRGAANKMFPRFDQWSEETRSAMLDGYMAGDGSNIRHYRVCKTVSPFLAAQVAMLAESLGFRTTTNIHNAPPGAGIGDRIFKETLPCYVVFVSPQRSKCPAYHFFEYDGVECFTRRIMSVEKSPYNGVVCNLVVEGCHTFQTAIGMSHNTMKPIELVERAIKNSSLRDDIVLDSFMGSGTTIIAAERTGRRGFGSEMDPRYCDVICQRYFDLTSVSPIREGDSAQWVDLALDQDKDTGKPKTRKPEK